MRITRSRIALVAVVLASLIVGAAQPARAFGGELDPAFSGDGIDVQDFGGSTRADWASSLLAEGNKVVVGGTYFDGTKNQPIVVQYLANGTPDPAFGTNGIARPAVGQSFTTGEIARYPNGNLLIAGVLTQNSIQFPAVLFLNPAGQNMNIFGTGAQTGYPQVAAAANFDSTGIVVSSGMVSGDPNRVLQVEKYNNGTPVAAFGTNGKVLADVGTGTDIGIDVAVDSVQRITVLGRCDRRISETAINSDSCLIRLANNGARDVEFGGSGKIMLDVDNQQDNPVQLLLHGANTAARITVVASTYVARYGPLGTPDTTFGTNGVARLGGFYATSGALEPDGSVLLVGKASGIATMRLTAAGVVDEAYGRPSVPTAYRTGDTANVIGRASDGGAYIAGMVKSLVGNSYTNTDWMAAKLQPKGAAASPAAQPANDAAIPLNNDTASQPVFLDVATANAAPDAGVLAIGLGSSSVSFPTGAPGTQTTAQLGDITFENTLRTGAPWSASVVACSMYNATAREYVYVDDMFLDPGNVSPAGVTPGAAETLEMNNPDDCYSSAAQTLVTGEASAQGVFTLTGTTLRVSIPANQPTGRYQGLLRYTLIG